MSMEIDTIYNEPNLDTMRRMPDDFIDLVVTSPPCDDLRKYNGYSIDGQAFAFMDSGLWIGYGTR